MILQLTGLGVGLGAAVRTPRWLAGDRLQELLRDPASPLRQSGDPSGAIRTSHRALRLLGRLPYSPWRNTCLYRSVAQCLVLRSYGVAARVEIGAKRDCATERGIEVHAWVSGNGDEPVGRVHTLLMPVG